MEAIKNAMKLIDETNYFLPWRDLLVSDYAVSMWQSIFSENINEDVYADIGKKLYMHKVPYVIANEYIDEVFRHLNMLDGKYFTIKNKIANEFLKNKLQYDRNIIEKDLNKQLSSVLQAKKELINAHLNWMKKFIDFILEIDDAPELDSKKCTIGLWIFQEKKLLENHNIQDIHNNLHAMAHSAIRMHKREDYAYFLLLYIDMLNSSYQIRDLVMNIYFSKKLTSIYSDYLTSQPNYLQLRDDIEKFPNESLLVILNIKEFSKFNLLYGHDVGDALIKEVIGFLKDLPKVDQVYRIYGDEFAVTFKEEDYEYVRYDFKMNLESHEYHIGKRSILLSFYASYSTLSKHALEHCEYGLLESKKHLGAFINATKIEKAVIQKYTKAMSLSQKLRIAFLDDRFICCYQPIFDRRSKKIVKYEALMRTSCLDGTKMYPAEFLGVLKDMYIYPEVTKIIIAKTFAMFEDKEYAFSINLSFADIINPETEAFIVAIVEKYPEVAKRCTFELLENEAIQNKDEVIRFFSLLHSFGVKISIDDFGSGFSNYDTIFNFDVDYIKIDGIITESLFTSSKSRVLLDSIITVARELGAQIIVEYVSSKEIYEYVSKLDVDMMQGFYLGKPSEKLL
jgi:EAL domain-containing protein (putative c-di-GMP-specific phosphodiesterase class I)/GGDEF domain-containing protein